MVFLAGQTGMQNQKNSWVTLARYANLAFSFGTTLAAALLLGFFGGRWLDRRLGTEPIFMVVGVLLGAVLAFKNLLDELGILTSKEGKAENGRNQDAD